MLTHDHSHLIPNSGFRRVSKFDWIDNFAQVELYDSNAILNRGRLDDAVRLGPKAEYTKMGGLLFALVLPHWA